MRLTSFVISTTPFDQMSGLTRSTQEEFEQEHVLFQDGNKEYIAKCMSKILETDKEEQ